jgi:hypothetical protein
VADKRRPEGPKALYFVGVLIVVACAGVGQGVALLVDGPAWLRVALWLAGLVLGFRVAALVNKRLFANAEA